MDHNTVVIISQILEEQLAIADKLKKMEEGIALVAQMDYTRGRRDACEWLLRCYQYGGGSDLRYKHYKNKLNILTIYLRNSPRYHYLKGYCDTISKLWWIL